MRLQELLEQQLDEIERLYKSDYTGGKDALYPGHSAKKYFELPGGSGLLYTVEGKAEPTSQDDAPLRSARVRWKHYADRGYALTKVDQKDVVA